MNNEEKNIPVEETVNEVETQEESKENSFNPQDYRLIMDMIKEMDSQYEMLKSFSLSIS